MHVLHPHLTERQREQSCSRFPSPAVDAPQKAHLLVCDITNRNERDLIFRVILRVFPGIVRARDRDWIHISQVVWIRGIRSKREKYVRAILGG